MSFSALEYLRHILDETKYIMNQTESLSQDEFIQNETLKRAFVRSIEIIGEATKKIPDDFKQKFPNIEWRAMAGMRDRLIHDYLGIDYDIVWDVVINKIPMLQQEVEQILQSEQNSL
ncbi:MAG: DUF86 domain-containing protein [Chloroflexota bacterium]